MTRRIDWRDGAGPNDLNNVSVWESLMTKDRARIAKLSAKRKRLISKCYQKAARAAKSGR